MTAASGELSVERGESKSNRGLIHKIVEGLITEH